MQVTMIDDYSEESEIRALIKLTIEQWRSYGKLAIPNLVLS